jgi:C4-dicarboxylate-specific signal transduction histidine kinase
MMFFLMGYIIVFYSIVMKVGFIGELFVGIIFFFGAIFVGILLQSKMLTSVRDNYLKAIAASESLHRERERLIEVNEKLQREITDRKQAEEALRIAHRDLIIKATDLESANEELSQYSHVVAHVLKAPLRGIRNYSDFL